MCTPILYPIAALTAPSSSQCVPDIEDRYRAPSTLIFGCRAFDVTQIIGGKFDCDRPNVFFQTVKLGCARDWEFALPFPLR